MSAPTFACRGNFESSDPARPVLPVFSSRMTGVLRLSLEARAAGEDLPLCWPEARLLGGCGFSPSSLLSWKNVESETWVAFLLGIWGGCLVGVSACDCRRPKEPEALVLRADWDLTVRIVALGLGS